MQTILSALRKNKFLIVSVLVFLLTRIIFAISTYHNDLGAFSLSGMYIAGKGEWLTFYDEVASTDQTGNIITHRNDIIFNYQPLAYILPSIVYSPFKDLMLSNGETFRNKDWLKNKESFFDFRLFVYKLPMILADLSIMLMLPLFFSSKKNKQLSVILWLLNPIAIYVSSFMGQVDIIISLLLLLALLLNRKNKNYLAIFMISISALVKPIGLILLPIVVIDTYHKRQNFIEMIFQFLFGIFIYFLGILPYLGSVSYKYYALFAEQLNKTTYASIAISSGTEVPLFFIALAIVVFCFWTNKINFLTAMITTLLSSLVFTHFHPQWLIWLVPLLLIQLIENKEIILFIFVSIFWLIILFSFDSSLHTQIFLLSKFEIPSYIVSSNLFKEMIQFARAGLIAMSIWLFTIPSSNKT